MWIINIYKEIGKALKRCLSMYGKKHSKMPIMILSKFMRASSMVFFLFLVQVATAADQQFCQRYTTTSIKQYEVAVQERMPNIQFPVWSNDYNHHNSWCLRVPQVDAQKGITMRDQAIKRFRASKPVTPVPGTNQQFCQRYAATSVRQYEVALKESVPNLQFPVWSHDYNGHYNWCLIVPRQDVKNGITLRDQIIKRHRQSGAPNSINVAPGVQPGGNGSTKQFFCAEYARMALEQLREARLLGVQNLFPPVWTTEYQGHFGWCQIANEQQANEQTAWRQQTIEQHKSQQGSSQYGTDQGYGGYQNSGTDQSSSSDQGYGGYQSPGTDQGSSTDQGYGGYQSPGTDQGSSSDQGYGGYQNSGTDQSSGDSGQSTSSEPSTKKKITCEAYAFLAVQQFEKAQSLGIPNLSPPTWTNDHHTHVKWCLQANEFSLASDSLKRQMKLEEYSSK